MGYRDLNNRGLHAMRMQQFMQGGGQPQMAPPQMEAKQSPIDELIPAIKSALEQGAALPDVIISLAQNQVPIQAIQQALMAAGIAQEEIQQAFQMLQQQQAELESQSQQTEGPVEPSAQPQEGAPAPEMAPEQAQMPMAQDGTEVGFAQQGQNNAGPTVNSDIPEYQEPVEEVISERLDEDGKVIKDNYEYKKTTDPNTGQVFYETRKKGSKNWTDAGEEGSTKYRAITDVFGDDKTGYKDSPERAQWMNFLGDEYKKDQDAKQMTAAMSAAEDQGIDFSKYGVKVINYPYGYQGVNGRGSMPPGHIEAVFYDKATGEPVNEINGMPTRINRWGSGWGGEGQGRISGDEGFTQPEVNFDALDIAGVRSADLDLTPEQMMNFIGEANKFRGTSYKNLTESQKNFLKMIPGVGNDLSQVPFAFGTGSDDNYDFLASNCADGVCRGLNLDRDQFTSAGITNPEKVMDYILQGNNVSNVKGKKGPSKEEFLKNTIDQSGINQYTIGGLSDKNINVLSNFADNISREEAQNAAKYAPMAVDYAKRTGEVLDRGIDLDQSLGDMVTNTRKYWRDLALNSAGTGIAGYLALPDGTIPTVLDAGAREYIYEPIKDATGGLIDLDQSAGDMWDNTVDYWKREGIGGLWPFEHGGQPGKYSSIINNNKMKYSNLFKNGGGYNNPGFRALPQYVQNKIKRNAQEGVEIAEAMPLDISAEQQAYMDAKAAYDAEMARVQGVRNKTAELARQYGDAGASYSDVGISDRLANWIDDTGFACNTYSCQIMREAGATIPQGTEPFEMNGRTYRPGDKLPIIPGNAQFNSYADKLGFELMPKGTMPTEAGDLIRGHMYNAGPGAGSGSFHSVLSAGYGDDKTLDLYNNPGGVYSGYTMRGQDGSDPMATGEGDYYTKDSGVMRYVGDTARLKEAMDKAKQAYDGSMPLDQSVVDSNPNSIANLTRQYGGEENMAVMQEASQGQGGPEAEVQRLIAIIQKQQAQMMQMQQQMQQMMQGQQEVGQAETAMQPTYRTQSAQKQSGGTVDLDTATIAKIMAAGGSVKFK
jgi:hypothetical protein